MKILDLFSGIGGFSLAAHWLGWETIAFVEKDEFCRKVLAKNFPGVEIYGDITEFSGKSFRGRCDIITGGFPCQPFSQAGKQQGRNDERHLFPQILRVISEVKPRWVVAENVRGLLSNESGQVFAEVITSLESEGYEVITFCIPASSVGAPHKRDRLWIIANSDGKRLQGRRSTRNSGVEGCGDRKQKTENDRTATQSASAFFNGGFTSDTDGQRQGRQPESFYARQSTGLARRGFGDSIANSNCNGNRLGRQRREIYDFDGNSSTEERRWHDIESGFGAYDSRFNSDSDTDTDGEHGEEHIGRNQLRETGEEISLGRSFPPRNIWNKQWQSVAASTCIRRMDDGISDELDVVGSRDNRTARLKALGNAIVPQIAYEIFKAIEAAEKIKKTYEQSKQ